MATPPPLAKSTSAVRYRDPRVERSRQVILSAVCELITDRGVAGITVDAIVARSGVARSTLYRHFATSTEVIAAAMEQLLPAPVVPVDAGPLRERLVQVLRELQGLTGSPMMPTLLTWFAVSYQPVTAGPESKSDNRPHLEALKKHIVARYREPLVTMLRAAVVAGDLRPELDPDLATAQLLGPLLFVTIVPQQTQPDGLYERIVDDFLFAHGTG